MKIAFFGTGNFSKNILEKLKAKSGKLKENLEVALVVSQPDKEVGRKRLLEETPIKIFARENNLKILQLTKLKDNFEFFQELRNLNLDFIVVVAYGKIIPKEILEIPKFGCINVHGSILPAYRGASPVQESLKNGDKKTGLTIMEMSEKMDEGNILQVQEIKIDLEDKAPDIFKKFEKIGPNLLLNTLKGVINGSIKGIPQDNSKASYCSKIEKKDGKIDFKNETAEEIYNKFRAYYIWPGIYTFYKGKKFDIVDTSPLTPLLSGGEGKKSSSSLRKNPPNPLYQGEKPHFSPLDKGGLRGVGPGEVGSIIKLENFKIGVICKKGILILKKVKLEGKKEVSIKDFVNGNKEFLSYKF